VNNTAAYDGRSGFYRLSDKREHRAIIGKDIGAKRIDAVPHCDFTQPLKKERSDASTSQIVMHKERNIRAITILRKHRKPAFGNYALRLSESPCYNKCDMSVSIDVAQII